MKSIWVKSMCKKVQEEFLGEESLGEKNMDEYKQLLTVLMARMTRTKRDVTVLLVSCSSTHMDIACQDFHLREAPLAQKGESVPVQPLHGSGAEYRLCLDVFVNLCNLDFRTAGLCDFIYRRQNTGSWTKTGDCRSNTGVPPPGCFLEEACETFSAGRSILGSGKIEKFLVTTVFSFSALITR